MSLPLRDPVAPGQTSVWDYPRRPRVVAEPRELKVFLGGRLVAWTLKGLRVEETAHPPLYFFPPTDVDSTTLQASEHPPSLCEFRGMAHYLDVMVSFGDRQVTAPAGAYAYLTTLPGYDMLTHYVSFYAGAMDACLVDGVEATAQPGGFYNGWITPDVSGPFKGYLGSEDW